MILTEISYNFRTALTKKFPGISEPVRMRSKHFVSALLFQFAGDIGHKTHGGKHDCGTEARPPHTQFKEFRRRRRIWPNHNIQGSRNGLYQLLDSGRVYHPRYKDGASPRLKI